MTDLPVSVHDIGLAPLQLETPVLGVKLLGISMGRGLVLWFNASTTGNTRFGGQTAWD